MEKNKKVSFRELVEKYAAESNVAPSDLKVIKLINQNPLIEKLEQMVLNTLTNCEELRLSTNSIKAIIPLAGMKKLRLLSLSRNQIKSIRGLEDVGKTLQQLWLSYNNIERLDNLSKCEALRVFYIAHNRVRDVDELDKLTHLAKLATVVFIGNEFYNQNGNKDFNPRFEILRRIPQLEMIDGVSVSMNERDEVEGYQQMMDAKKEEEE